MHKYTILIFLCLKKVRIVIINKIMLNFLNFSVKFVIIFFIIFVLFAFSTLWYFSIGLPDYKKLSNYQPPISSRVYSEDSKLVAEYALEKRLFIPYESIPEKIINSFCRNILFLEIVFNVRIHARWCSTYTCLQTDRQDD